MSMADKLFFGKTEKEKACTENRAPDITQMFVQDIKSEMDRLFLTDGSRLELSERLLGPKHDLIQEETRKYELQDGRVKFVFEYQIGKFLRIFVDENNLYKPKILELRQRLRWKYFDISRAA